jgi:alpha-beta hydrolase superfamily lysophospholipase
LDAGENTLEAQLCRVLIRSIVQSSSSSTEGTTGVTTSQDGSVATSATAYSSHTTPVLSVPAFTDSYIQFMRTPGSHNDTYASTAHRMFFANLVRGYDPAQCADNDGHNVDAIDALTLTVPVIIAFSEEDRNLRNAKIREVIAVTRKSRVLQRYAEMYSDILVAGAFTLAMTLCTIHNSLNQHTTDFVSGI